MKVAIHDNAGVDDEEDTRDEDNDVRDLVDVHELEAVLVHLQLLLGEAIALAPEPEVINLEIFYVITAIKMIWPISEIFRNIFVFLFL